MEHQIIFRRICDNATNVVFHPHPSLDKIEEVSGKAITNNRAFPENAYQEAIMHYNEDNQYANLKKA
jgi:hypothetical protein